MIYILINIVTMVAAVSEPITTNAELKACAVDDTKYVCPESETSLVAAFCCDTAPASATETECQFVSHCIQGSTTSNEAFIYPSSTSNGDADITSGDTECDMDQTYECDAFTANIDTDEFAI